MLSSYVMLSLSGVPRKISRVASGIYKVYMYHKMHEMHNVHVPVYKLFYFYKVQTSNWKLFDRSQEHYGRKHCHTKLWGGGGDRGGLKLPIHLYILLLVRAPYLLASASYCAIPIAKYYIFPISPDFHHLGYPASCTHSRLPFNPGCVQTVGTYS